MSLQISVPNVSAAGLRAVEIDYYSSVDFYCNLIPSGDMKRLSALLVQEVRTCWNGEEIVQEMLSNHGLLTAQ